MEVIRAIVTVTGCLHKVFNLIVESKGRGHALASDLSSMKDDFGLLAVAAAKNQLPLEPAVQLQLQELAFDIEDFIHTLWVPGERGSFVLSLIGADPRHEHCKLVREFKEKIKKLREELPSGGTPTPPPAGVEGSPIPYAQEVDLVGVEGPKREIVELLSPRADPRDNRIGVISIVGCRGSGKTALARALYEDKDVAKDFDYKAWVVASDPSSADILNKILQEVVPASASAPEGISGAFQQFINKIIRVLGLLASARGTTSEALAHFAKDKRYLVFLDDVQPGAPWGDIKKAFCENIKNSRIIVTTSVPSVARAASPGSYMYTMQHLDRGNSTGLFRSMFKKGVGCGSEGEDVLRPENINIITDKCDGLPLALISTAKCLCKQGADPNLQIFEEVSRQLCACMADSEIEFEQKKRGNGNGTAFVEMRRALVQPYENLLSGYKDCLLYLSIFSNGNQINTKSLVRRLIAEGLVPGDRSIVEDPKLAVGYVCECLRTLMDKLMIEPVPIRNYYNAAKWCRVRSIMREFTIKKAVDINFVSLIQGGQPKYRAAGKMRRVTVQSSPDVGSTRLDLSVVRSLAIFESGIPNIKECSLVRVLDIERCPVLAEVLDICELRFLKYLSLRGTGILDLPKELEKLKCLETLDSRETGVTTKLPVEVIMLPQLAYLFGKFELKNVNHNVKKLDKFFREKKSKSKLHTLGGICLDENQDLKVVELVIQHAKMLKKVKVWCKGTQNLGHINLAATIAKRSVDLNSVSIDFNGVHNTFLGFLGTISSSTIGSIKLREGFGDLPVSDRLKTAKTLRKLHLFSTGRTSKQLAELQYLEGLECLKLAEADGGLWNSEFHVKIRGFESLIWLCFEAPKLPPIKIDKGAMTVLASLQVLCTVGHVVTDISHLAKLNEVILHPDAAADEVTAWKEEAKKHINRPHVENQQRNT